jgi:hypothetical protein
VVAQSPPPQLSLLQLLPRQLPWIAALRLGVDALLVRTL